MSCSIDVLAMHFISIFFFKPQYSSFYSSSHKTEWSFFSFLFFSSLFSSALWFYHTLLLFHSKKLNYSIFVDFFRFHFENVFSVLILYFFFKFSIFNFSATLWIRDFKFFCCAKHISHVIFRILFLLCNHASFSYKMQRNYIFTYF